MPTNSSSLRAARGFTLIEVLIAILVFSFGVLGAVGMQARVLQMSTQNGDRNRASMLANELAAQMWQQQTVSVDTTAWAARVSNPLVSGLPSGSGSVSTSSPNGTPTATITITWKATTASAAATVLPSQYVTSVVIP